MNFNPRAPYGARPIRKSFPYFCKNFNPRAPYGARLARNCVPYAYTNFNPRAPYGARLFTPLYTSCCFSFQSTRPVWGATRGGFCFPSDRRISIHAPRMGRDLCGYNAPSRKAISIHAPRMGRDDIYFYVPCKSAEFQSTRPVWGATAKLHNFPVQFCARVTVNSMPQTIFWTKYTCGIVQTTRAYPYFRCEAPGKSLSACASHSDHQHALRLIAGP